MKAFSKILIGTISVAGIASGLSTSADAIEPMERTYYKVIDISSAHQDVRGPIIGKCSAGSGGVCAIQRVKTVSTQIEVDLGISSSAVSESLHFSKSQESSSSSTCTSHTLKGNQMYRAYALGTSKTYRIQKWYEVQLGSYDNKRLEATSGVKTSWQPYNYPSVDCIVGAR